MDKHELFIDNFAGGGGTSTGIEMAIGAVLMLLSITILMPWHW